MHRTVERGEGRALPCSLERGTAGKLPSSLYVAGRQGTQCAGELGSGEIREVPPFERGEPRIELEPFSQGVAERKGFEPLEAFRLQRFSRPPP